MENEKRKDYLLPASILLATILVVGAIIYSTGAKNTNTEQQANLQQLTQLQGTQDSNQSKTPQIGNSVVLGDPQAPVAITIFSDYQCPFCGKFFEETESSIRQNYVTTGKAKMVYKSLAFLGPESIAAAQAADCAKDQKKFWQYHDALFEAEIKDGQENNGNLNRDLFKKIASDLNMNVDEFLSCYDSQKYASEVVNDMNEATSLMDKVSTPTVFINDTLIQGAYPYSTFSQVIDEALNKK